MRRKLAAPEPPSGGLRADLLLYAIADVSLLAGRDVTDACEAALRGGVTMLQLRDKSSCDCDLRGLAERICGLCRSYDVPFIINDRVSLAVDIGCGVHVGQGDMTLCQAREALGAGALIGVSARTSAQALEAEKGGASYIGCGAVFPTKTKRDARVIGPEGVKKVCMSSALPVVAIGGIAFENASALAGCGICGVAVSSSVFSSPDIEASARRMLKVALSLAGRDGEL